MKNPPVWVASLAQPTRGYWIPSAVLACNHSPVGLNPQRRQFATTGKYIHKVPMMGDSITEGTITTWIKNVGDTVAEDETFVTIETDKVRESTT